MIARHRAVADDTLRRQRCYNQISHAVFGEFAGKFKVLMTRVLDGARFLESTFEKPNAGFEIFIWSYEVLYVYLWTQMQNKVVFTKSQLRYSIFFMRIIPLKKNPNTYLYYSIFYNQIHICTVFQNSQLFLAVLIISILEHFVYSFIDLTKCSRFKPFIIPI